MKAISLNKFSQKSAFLLLLTFLLISVPAAGGEYELVWGTIDGGGGRSTGGDYVLIGTIGQPDAGEMSGDDYELSGGFWPAGPLLSCFVDFEHFAEFALYWLDSPCDEANNWCEGSDLDFLGSVNLDDLRILAYYWLGTCPLDWPWY